MDSSNVDNHSKTSVFDKFKYLSYKYHRFSKIRGVGEHLNQFPVLSYDCMSSLSQFQLGENPTSFYSEINKHESFFDEKKDYKKCKNND